MASLLPKATTARAASRTLARARFTAAAPTAPHRRRATTARAAPFRRLRLRLLRLPRTDSWPCPARDQSIDFMAVQIELNLPRRAFEGSAAAQIKSPPPPDRETRAASCVRRRKSRDREVAAEWEAEKSSAILATTRNSDAAPTICVRPKVPTAKAANRSKVCFQSSSTTEQKID